MSTPNHNPDVLTCLANLSSDEVFTPPELANKLLDLLPQKLWSDKTARFLDPVCKSGVFLREIAKRLLLGLEKDFPDLEKRINHIFMNQLFGIGITELTSLLSRRSVYCSKVANGKYSICNQFKTAEGNVFFSSLQHSWKGNACCYCGASKGRYSRQEDQEAHAYNFIHPHKHEVLNDMKFDVIIGNPPYQLSDEGYGKSATPIYDKFVLQAKALNPRYLIMIIPARWFVGGKGLDAFRKEMLNDTRIKKLIEFRDSKECFPNVDISGGVCYFLWDKEYNGKCEFVNKSKDTTFSSVRYLNEFDTLVRSSIGALIIKKIKSFHEPDMSTKIFSRNLFGLDSTQHPSTKGDLILITAQTKEKGKLELNKVTTGEGYIQKWKVMFSRSAYSGGNPNKEGKWRFLSRVEVLPPYTVCTDSYVVAGCFDDEKHAQHLCSYIKTKFVRFLVVQRAASQDINRNRFAFVPQQDWSREWTDQELYKKYGLSQEEIEFIENMIHPME